MEVSVGEDQLSLAIGKKGQNVRLATRLVGWEIKIVSEEILKKEVARQMGKLMASGEAVPLTALEGVTTSQAETLATKGIDDVEKLAATSVDDLVDYLDVSLDQAEAIRTAASLIVELRNSEDEIGETDQAAQPDAEESSTVETVQEIETEKVEANSEEAITSTETLEGTSESGDAIETGPDSEVEVEGTEEKA